MRYRSLLPVLLAIGLVSCDSANDPFDSDPQIAGKWFRTIAESSTAFLFIPNVDPDKDSSCFSLLTDSMDLCIVETIDSNAMYFVQQIAWEVLDFSEGSSFQVTSSIFRQATAVPTIAEVPPPMPGGLFTFTEEALDLRETFSGTIKSNGEIDAFDCTGRMRGEEIEFSCAGGASLTYSRQNPLDS